MHVRGGRRNRDGRLHGHAKAAARHACRLRRWRLNSRAAATAAFARCTSSASGSACTAASRASWAAHQASAARIHASAGAACCPAGCAAAACSAASAAASRPTAVEAHAIAEAASASAAAVRAWAGWSAAAGDAGGQGAAAGAAADVGVLAGGLDPAWAAWALRRRSELRSNSRYRLVSSRISAMSRSAFALSSALRAINCRNASDHPSSFLLAGGCSMGGRRGGPEGAASTGWQRLSGARRANTTSLRTRPHAHLHTCCQHPATPAHRRTALLSVALALAVAGVAGAGRRGVDREWIVSREAGWRSGVCRPGRGCQGGPAGRGREEAPSRWGGRALATQRCRAGFPSQHDRRIAPITLQTAGRRKRACASLNCVGRCWGVQAWMHSSTAPSIAISLSSDHTGGGLCHTCSGGRACAASAQGRRAACTPCAPPACLIAHCTHFLPAQPGLYTLYHFGAPVSFARPRHDTCNPHWRAICDSVALQINGGNDNSGVVLWCKQHSQAPLSSGVPRAGACRTAAAVACVAIAALCGTVLVARHATPLQHKHLLAAKHAQRAVERAGGQHVGNVGFRHAPAPIVQGQRT